MAYGLPICACCGSDSGVEDHHLYLRADGCPDDLTVWLCHVCHGRAHGMARRVHIGKATKQALASAKANGKQLGGLRDYGREAKAAAVERAKALAPLFKELEGKSYREIARVLNDRSVATLTGKPWSAMTVSRARERLAAA